MTQEYECQSKLLALPLRMLWGRKELLCKSVGAASPTLAGCNGNSRTNHTSSAMMAFGMGDALPSAERTWHGSLPAVALHLTARVFCAR